MTPAQLRSLVIRPTLEWLGPTYASPEVEVLLVAIAMQESRLLHRIQIPKGPARSLWQIEPPTARRTYEGWERARWAFSQISVPPPYGDDDWLQWNDIAACVIARGILWLEKSPLPTIGDHAAAWSYYADRCWRPGKPHPETWADCYAAAMGA